MPVIDVSGFLGSSKAVNPRLLKSGVGVYVEDASPGHNDLRPMFEPSAVASILQDEQQQTIYRMGRDSNSNADYWISWTGVVDVVLAQDGDGLERTYFTDGVSPQWTDNTIAISGGPPYPQATRNLSVPAPTTAILASVSTAGDGTESYVGYIYTFVNDIGWESAPSPLSNLLLCKAGSINDLSGIDTPPPGNYGIDKIRIYRTQSDANGSADYYFLREISLDTSSQDDARSLGELLGTKGWTPLPDAATRLCGMWNGMLAAVHEKTVMFCEPYSPYAWPVKYDINSRDTPVALAAWQQNLIVLTSGAPMLIVGSSPEGLDQSNLNIIAPCKSRRGVVSMGHGVVWPSSDGLIYVGATPATNITIGLLTERQWRDLSPETMVAGQFGRFYACSFISNGDRRGFVIDPLNPSNGIWWLSFGWDACWFDELQNKLFFLDGSNIKILDGDENSSRLDCKFHSKHFSQHSPINYGWIKVISSGYPVNVDVYSDDRVGGMVKRISRVINSSLPESLPSGFVSENWAINITSSHDVQAVRLATTVRELTY